MTTRELLPDRVAEEEALNPMLQAGVLLETAARQLDLEEWIVRRLRHMERELTVNLSLQDDDGRALTVTGYRVQHTGTRGPTLGGVRFLPSVQLEQLRAAALATTWECALFDLPFGGAAGAVVCDPQRLSERELRDVVKEYVTALRGFLGPTTDVIMPDVGSNPQTASWMFDAFVRVAGHMEAAVVTGKPPGLWGLPDYDGLVARSLVLLLETVLADRGLGLPGLRVAVQGFGKLGGAAARLLHEAGARIVAVADVSGGLYHERGLDVPALLAYAETNKLVFGFPEGTAVTNREVLDAACDVLIAAACERQLTHDAAEQLQAAVVLEAVKQAITPEGDKALARRGVTVVPDMLANATRLLASYVEWTRNMQRNVCPGDGQLVGHLKACIERAYREVRHVAGRDHCGLRRAAELLAVERVATSLRLRN